MKEITMKTKIIDMEYVFEESYEIDNDVEPQEYAQGLIDRFNATLRPDETPRELVTVIVTKENVKGKQEHKWEKQNLVTIKRAGRMYDVYRCNCCGITGKRYGIGGDVTRDSKYKADKYQYCQNN